MDPHTWAMWEFTNIETEEKQKEILELMETNGKDTKQTFYAARNVLLYLLKIFVIYA